MSQKNKSNKTDLIVSDDSKDLEPRINLTLEQKRLAVSLSHQGATLAQIAEELCIETRELNIARRHDPKFETILLAARQMSLEVLADSLVDIPDEYKDVQRARLKSENIRWLLSKRKPEVYGDKLNLDVNHKVDIGTALHEARARVNVTDSIDVTPHQNTDAIKKTPDETN